MKLVTFETADESGRSAQHIGALLDDLETISDFSAGDGHECFRDMLALMDGGEQALDRARELVRRPRRQVALREARLLAPVPVPRQIFDCLCFEKHLVQSARNAHLLHGSANLVDTTAGMPEVYRQLPVYYKGNRFSVIGTDEDIICPRYSRKLDYELEFGIFLGRGGKDIPEERAFDHIFGYCIFNDVSARDQQWSEMRGMLGPSKGKDFDTGNVMGPWLVTRDEIPDPQNLRMSAWLNGEHVSSGSSAQMMHTFEKIIAYSSQDETRHVGEFIGSGTVGDGCGLELGRFLQHGDVLELEVEGLGRLRNRIVFQEAPKRTARI